MKTPTLLSPGDLYDFFLIDDARVGVVTIPSDSRFRVGHMARRSVRNRGRGGKHAPAAGCREKRQACPIDGQRLRAVMRSG